VLHISGRNLALSNMPSLSRADSENRSYFSLPVLKLPGVYVTRLLLYDERYTGDALQYILRSLFNSQQDLAIVLLILPGRLPASKHYSKNKTPVLGNAIPVLVWKTKTGVVRRLFFKIDLCSATSMESSRRDLLNDVTEHRSILKNNQNTFYPHFSSSP